MLSFLGWLSGSSTSVICTYNKSPVESAVSFFLPPAARRSWSLANRKDESTTAYASLQVLRAAWCPLHDRLGVTDAAGRLVIAWHPLNLRASYNNGHGIVPIGDASGTMLSSLAQ